MQLVQIDTLIGAKYNPRLLSESNFEMLQESIKELGIIKPVIVRAENSTLIAGHQRTKAMAALGIKETPAYVLKNLNYADEVRFNQMHNACEIELSPKAPKMRVEAELVTGFQRVKNSQIKIVSLGDLNAVTSTLAKLILKYGEFGCPICDLRGNIRISAAYAYAAKLTGKDLDIVCLDDDKLDKALYYMSKQYGVFYYDNLEKKTYQQRYAQKKRLRNGKKGESSSQKSYLYEKYVLPYLADKPKTTRILDFGAGQKDYIKKLRAMGFNTTAVDPYHMKANSVDIDIENNSRDFKKICIELEKAGRFDIVICDSVLNSVDSTTAEWAVIHSIAGLCKTGGKVFISGRSCEKELARNSSKIVAGMDSYVRFFDANHFSGIYRNGEWFYQKFHTKEDIEKIGQTIGGDYEVHFNSQAFELIATKEERVDKDTTIHALEFEFNLPLPNGRRYGLQNEIRQSYENRHADN